MLRIGSVTMAGLLLIPVAGLAKSKTSLSPSQNGRLNKALIGSAEYSGTQGDHAYAPKLPSVRRTLVAADDPGTYKVKARYFEQAKGGKRQFDAAGTFLYDAKTSTLTTTDGKSDIDSLGAAWSWGKNYP